MELLHAQPVAERFRDKVAQHVDESVNRGGRLGDDQREKGDELKAAKEFARDGKLAFLAGFVNAPLSRFLGLLAAVRHGLTPAGKASAGRHPSRQLQGVFEECQNLIAKDFIQTDVGGGHHTQDEQ